MLLFSPSLTYIEQVYPMLKRIVQAEVRLNAWGWYPRVEWSCA